MKKQPKEVKPVQVYTGRLKTPHLNPRVMDTYQLQINGNLIFNFSYLENQPYNVDDIAEVFLEELYSRKLGSRSFNINEGKLVDLASGGIVEAEELDFWSRVQPMRVVIARGLLGVEVIGLSRFRGTSFSSIQ